MPAFLADDVHMFVARFFERLRRKLAVTAFDLLQAQHVWLRLHKEAANSANAQAHGVDVPGRDSQHRARVWRLAPGNSKRPDRIQRPGLDVAPLRGALLAGRGVRQAAALDPSAGGTTPSRGMSGGSRCIYATGAKKSRFG